MQERLTIARPYALAAFEFAQERNELGMWSDALNLLGVIIADQEMRRVVRDPRVPEDTLIGLINEIGGAHFTPFVQNFVKMLVTVERIDIAPEIAQLFGQHRAKAEGSLAIEVTAAYPLDDAEQNKIAQAIKADTGREIEVNCLVDPDLIGGAVVRAGDTVVDLSVRGRLQSLAADLV